MILINSAFVMTIDVLIETIIILSCPRWT